MIKKNDMQITYNLCQFTAPLIRLSVHNKQQTIGVQCNKLKKQIAKYKINFNEMDYVPGGLNHQRSFNR